MQVTYDARAFVNDDGQVSVGLRIDGREQPTQSGTREQSRAFALEILSKQGDEGERAAVEWLRSKGWDVGKPKPRQTDSVTQKYGVPRWAFAPKGDEKPDEKPVDKEKKPDLPALYREAAWKVRAFAGPHANANPWAHARDALIACAKADPETAEGLIIQADLIHDYNDKQLRVVADGLDDLAKLAETAADIASPIKLAQMVWEALGNGGNADEWSLDGARAYLRGRMPSTLAKLHTDLADRVRRYVEAQ